MTDLQKNKEAPKIPTIEERNQAVGSRGEKRKGNLRLGKKTIGGIQA